MKVIRVRATLSVGYYNANREEEIEVYVPDGASEKEIEEAIESTVKEWMYNYIDWGWQVID